MHLISIWINEMKEHEYNPVHIHQGKFVYWLVFSYDIKIT